MAHVTVADTVPRVDFTVGGSSTTNFAFTFTFYDNADIAVYVGGTKQTLTTHYTITGTAGTDNGFVGGTVVLGTGVTNTTVSVLLDIAAARSTDFPSSGPFNVTTLNTELDKFTSINRQLEHKLTRAVSMTEAEIDGPAMTLPAKADRLGKYLAFNEVTGAAEAGASSDDVASLAAVTDDIAVLADIEDGTDATDAIQTVAGVAANVSTVAGVAANVTTVAGIAADVTAVAGDATDIGAVAAKATEIGRLGTSDAVADLALLSTSAIVTDMDLLATTANVTAMGLLGTSANVTAMGLLGNSGVITDMGILGTADVVSDMDLLGTSTVVGNLNTLGTSDAVADMNTLAAISSDITSVAADSTDIGAVAAKATEIGRLGTADAVADLAILGTTAAVADMAILGTPDCVADMNTLATSDIISDLNTLATSDVVADLNTLATTDIVNDMNTLAAVASDISNVASQVIGYTFSTTTSMSDPGSAGLRFNHGTIASCTAIAIDDLDNSGADVSPYIITFDDSTNTIKGTLLIRSSAAASTFAMFSVTGLTDNSGWTQLAVTHLASNGTFSDASTAYISFLRAGNKGLDGSGSMTSFTAAGDSGSNQTIADGNTLQLTGGDGVATVASATDTVTIAADLKSNGGIVIESGELAVDLAASSITNTLAASDGGTGLTDPSTSGNILTSNGSGAWVSSPPAGAGAGYFLGGASGATGDTTNGLEDIFRVNSATVDNSCEIAAGTNASATGPLSVSSGVTVTASGVLVII